MAGNPVDPLQTLQAALTVTANSQEQADLLASLRESLEIHPATIPILVKTLIGIVVNAGDSLLKRWVIDLLHFAICRSTLVLEQRSQMSSQALDTLAQLLNDPKAAIVKIVIQCMTTVYPLLFRQLCTNRSNPTPWNTLSTCKARIIELVWAPLVNNGVRVSAMKFLQRVILVQTRGISDPRLQNKNDPNISFCPVDHPFISAAKLEIEGQKLLEGVIATLYRSKDVDLLSAMLNSWGALIKQRPALTPIIITALQQWTPSNLSELAAFCVKSVEKAIRILLSHVSRMAANTQYMAQITDTLFQQGFRMDKAASEEKKRKAAALSAAADNRKRSSSTTNEQALEFKRVKLESEASTTSSTSFLSAFDFTSLPAPLITDLIVANLEAFSESTLINLVEAYRQSRGLNTSSTSTFNQLDSQISNATLPEVGSHVAPIVSSSSLPTSFPSGARRSITDVQETYVTPVPQSNSTFIGVKDEPIDPLQMDIDQDELEYEPELLNEALSGDIPAADEEAFSVLNTDIDFKLIDFKLSSPHELMDDDRMDLISKSIKRISSGAEVLKYFGDAIPVDSTQAGESSVTELWMLLLVRMVTRVAEPPIETPADQMDESGKNEDEFTVHDFYMRQDQLRQTLCEYIMADFPSRIRLATTWMNEEWYNDQIRLAIDHGWRPNYDIWLNQIVAAYQALLDGRDRTFSRFLLDLPAVPADVLGLLRDLCVDYNSADRMQVGYITLRGLVMQRPSMRTDALNVLLELTTHPEKKTRGAAINTVKIWVPNNQPMDAMVREFALQMLRKLQLRPTDIRHNTERIPISKDVIMNGDESPESPAVEPIFTTLAASHHDENMEDGQLPVEDLVHTPYLPERVELPAQKSHVLQHVELLFALSVKVPEFLDEIFSAYGQMDETVQEAVQDLIAALIRSLGPNHGKLLTLMRTCPSGAESLALRVLTIFTDYGRASSQLVALVKALINERDLDARFLIPIISEMDKPDIMRHLPRIVSTLNGQPEPKNIVRSVFMSLIIPHNSSLKLPPAELMVLLHKSEKEIGLKSSMEAIGICFSMTDIFRYDVLAVVMQQILDEPVLPVLFLRTVIQAVSTYKSLVGFVSTTLLSRLITKKIWTNPPLWEGFIRCAKSIAPASFGALLQLPKDQLRELVDKQPSLKSGLRDYVSKKATNKARIAGFLDIFSDSPGEEVSATLSVLQPDMTLS